MVEHTVFIAFLFHGLYQKYHIKEAEKEIEVGEKGTQRSQLGKE